MKKLYIGFKNLLSKMLIGLIRLYQITLSPYIGRACRYTPTCSNYGIEAIRKHGPFKGTWLLQSVGQQRLRPGPLILTTNISKCRQTG